MLSYDLLFVYILIYVIIYTISKMVVKDGVVEYRYAHVFTYTCGLVFESQQLRSGGDLYLSSLPCPLSSSMLSSSMLSSSSLSLPLMSLHSSSLASSADQQCDQTSDSARQTSHMQSSLYYYLLDLSK